jgi:hypothetical protein
MIVYSQTVRTGTAARAALPDALLQGAALHQQLPCSWRSKSAIIFLEAESLGNWQK